MKIYRSSEKSDFETMVKIFIGALLLAVILSLVGCGIRAWSASTEATYYLGLVENDLSQKRFLVGWLKRIGTA